MVICAGGVVLKVFHMLNWPGIVVSGGSPPDNLDVRYQTFQTCLLRRDLGSFTASVLKSLCRHHIVLLLLLCTLSHQKKLTMSLGSLFVMNECVCMCVGSVCVCVWGGRGRGGQPPTANDKLPPPLSGWGNKNHQKMHLFLLGWGYLKYMHILSLSFSL